MILAIGIAAIVFIIISSVFFAALRLRNATQDYRGCRDARRPNSRHYQA